MSRLGLDLESTAVFLDFDGTIAVDDVGLHVLTHAAPYDGWWPLHEQFERGEIESRECLVGQWELVVGDEADLRAIATEVAIDDAFEPLVTGLRAAGAQVAVVSDGFGFYVHPVCAPLGIDVYTNDVDFATRELVFPHEDRCCPCSSCGVCKQAPIKDARYDGLTTVLVGDGASDRKAAMLADVVFAKDALARWCSIAGVPAIGFDTLADVHEALLGVNVAFGSDERTPLTDAVRGLLEAAGHRVLAVGPVATGDDAPSDVEAEQAKQWAEVGHEVGALVATGAADTAVLFCWTGTGASIAANKVPGARAALCTDAATAEGARRWNDANVLVMGLRLTSPELAREMLDAWFATGPDPGEAANIGRLDAPPA